MSDMEWRETLAQITLDKARQELREQTAKADKAELERDYFAYCIEGLTKAPAAKGPVS